MEKGTLIGQGRTAEVYAWGADRILKLYEEHMPPHLVELEYRLTRAAQAAAIPVPAAEELVQVDGRCGIIFERLEGPSMLKCMANQPWKLVAFARQLGELHAKIHQASLPPGLPTQKAQIEHGILASKDLPAAAKDKCLLRLAELPDGESLCHGDFHPDNILMTSRGPVIIDWMTATRGAPLADVSRTNLIFQTSGLPPGSPWHLRLLVNASRALIVSIYVKRYLRIHPASRSQITAWQLPLAAARLREVEQYPKETQAILKRIEADLG